MITIEMAGLRIGLDTVTPYVLRSCARFLTDQTPDFTVGATKEQIENECRLTSCRPQIGEFVCLYREIAERLPDFDRFVLHGATIQEAGRACIFTAKSGTGKSTHVRLWMERYGERVRIVNGDKPILWKREDGWYACGTPWCGKEGLTSTDCVRVAGLCLLERAQENTIRRAEKSELIQAIFHQIYRPKDEGRLLRFLTLFDDFLQSVPVWKLGCNMEPEAAEIAHDAMLKKELDKRENVCYTEG